MTLKFVVPTALALTVLAGSALAQTAAPAPDAAQPAAPPAAAAPAAPAAPAPIPDAGLSPSSDILQSLKASPNFTILVKALDATGLSPVLERPGPFTLIAPTDAAFQALPPAQLADLMKPENAGQLQGLLTYHLINAAVPPAKIQGTKGGVQTVANHEVEIDATGATAKFDDANVQGQSHVANGYVYVVDKVLTQPGAAAAAAPTAAPAG